MISCDLSVCPVSDFQVPLHQQLLTPPTSYPCTSKQVITSAMSTLPICKSTICGGWRNVHYNTTTMQEISPVVKLVKLGFGWWCVREVFIQLIVICTYFRVSALKSKRAIAGVLCVDKKKTVKRFLQKTTYSCICPSFSLFRYYNQSFFCHLGV